MAKPYSMDLRERAVATVLKEGLSRREFGGALRGRAKHGDQLVRRVQETGSAAPAQMGGHKPKAIAGEHAMFLARRVREGPFTLRGLVVELGRARP